MQFLAAGRHGDMTWMATTADRRRHPSLLWPDVRSIIMLAMSYAPEPDLFIRTGGGVLFLLGSLIMVYNLWKTVQVGPAEIAQPTRPLAGARA